MKGLKYAIGGLALLAGLCDAADATTVFSLTCTGAFGQLSTAILNNATWTSISGADATVQPGDVIALTGLCDDVVYPFFGLTITNHNYNVATDTTPSLVTTDGIEGQVVVSHAQSGVTLIGISIEGQSGVANPALTVDQQSQASVANSRVIDASGAGVLVERSSSLTLTNTTVSASGQAGVAGQNDGIDVVGASSLFLGGLLSSGSVDATQEVTVSGNPGNGIALVGNSSLSMAGGSVTGNSQAQIFASGGSSARIDGADITQTVTPTEMPAALVQIGGSAVLLTGGADVSGGAFADATSVASTSSLVLNGATVSTTLANANALHADTSSNIISYGGNTVQSTSGVAVEVLRGSSFAELVPTLANAGPVFNYATQIVPGFTGTPAQPTTGADHFTGTGTVEMQSDMEIGTGSATPSIWTGAITVQQNSSFRLDGGISITGGVSLIQGSNGFFNKSLGGTNSVAVTCTGTDSAHVAGPANVSPALTLVASGVGCYAF
jgi:hypothetical protein